LEKTQNEHCTISRNKTNINRFVKKNSPQDYHKYNDLYKTGSKVPTQSYKGNRLISNANE